MTTELPNTNQCLPADHPLALKSNEVLGAGAEARGCDNCGKRGPWQTEHGTGKNKAMTYELAECHHLPKPAFWRNAGPLWVSHSCGSECRVWSPLKAPNVPGKPGGPAASA